MSETMNSTIGATVVGDIVISHGAKWSGEPTSKDVIAAFDAGIARAKFERTIFARSFKWPLGKMIRRIPWVQNTVRQMAVAEIAHD